MTFAGLQDHKTAIESYDRALAIDPSFSIAYFTRGSAFEALGQYENAAESFRAMISLQPDFVDAWIDQGRALQELEKYPEARLPSNVPLR